MQTNFPLPGTQNNSLANSALVNAETLRKDPKQFIKKLIDLAPNQRLQTLITNFQQADNSQKWQLIDSLYHENLYLTAYELIKSWNLHEKATTQLSPQQWLTIAQNLPQQLQVEVCRKYLTYNVIQNLNSSVQKEVMRLNLNILANAFQKNKLYKDGFNYLIANNRLSEHDLNAKYYSIWVTLAFQICIDFDNFFSRVASTDIQNDMYSAINEIFQAIKPIGPSEQLNYKSNLLHDCVHLNLLIFNYKKANLAGKPLIWLSIIESLQQLYYNFEKLDKPNPSNNALVTEFQKWHCITTNTIINVLNNTPAYTTNHSAEEALKAANLTLSCLDLYKDYNFNNKLYQLIYANFRTTTKLHTVEYDANLTDKVASSKKRNLVSDYKKIYFKLTEIEDQHHLAKFYLHRTLTTLTNLWREDQNYLNLNNLYQTLMHKDPLKKIKRSNNNNNNQEPTILQRNKIIIEKIIANGRPESNEV